MASVILMAVFVNAQLDNLHHGGHFILDSCSVEDPTSLEFYIDEDGFGHIQHHELSDIPENAHADLIDFHTCTGSDPLMTFHKSPVIGSSSTAVPGAMRFALVCGDNTEDIQGFNEGFWVSLTGVTGCATGNTKLVHKLESIARTVRLENNSSDKIRAIVGEAMGEHDIAYSTEEMQENGFPVYGVSTTSGSSFLLACLDELCTKASIAIVRELRGLEGIGLEVDGATFTLSSGDVSARIESICTEELTGEFQSYNGRPQVCTGIPSSGPTELFMWMDVGVTH